MGYPQPRIPSPNSLRLASHAILAGAATILLLLSAQAGGTSQPRTHTSRIPHRRVHHRAFLPPTRLYYHRSSAARILAVPALPPPRPIKPRIPTAAVLYQRSLKADDLYTYRGRQVTTYWRTGHAVSTIVSHRAPHLTRIDYVAPDSQRGRSWVSDETQEWLFNPQQRVLLHTTLAPGAEAVADAATDYSLLKSNYLLSVLPQTLVIADRKAFVLTITRYSNRMPARKFWIDASTGLVLKQDNYREDGKLAVTATFADINFRVPLPRSLFSLSALAARPGVHRQEQKPTIETVLPLSHLERQLGGVAIAPHNLAGYRLLSATYGHNGKRPLLHLRYSDGLNLVSVFELLRSQTRHPTRVPAVMHPIMIGHQLGHIRRRTSPLVLNWDRRTLNITLLGEIDEATLLRLANALDADPR